MYRSYVHTYIHTLKLIYVNTYLPITYLKNVFDKYFSIGTYISTQSFIYY